MRISHSIATSLLLAAQVTAAPVPARVEVFFTPGDKCTNAIVKELNAAKKTIRIQAYSFTSTPIAKAAVDAQARGVKVQAVLDQSNQTDQYSSATFLAHGGCDVRIDSDHAIAHNKVIVIDDATVITGSFNFTNAAEKSNAENVLIIRESPDTVRRYTENWQKHYDHSKPYVAPAPPPGTAETRGAKSAVVVYATTNGKRYHREGCEGLRGGGKPMTVADAKAKGLTPCGMCKPAG